MFGMTSEEFWENDPQLYWSYRLFFYKKTEMEQKEKAEFLKYSSWLNGNMDCMATSISLSNAFSKGAKKEYPKYEKVFATVENDTKKKKKLTKQEINVLAQQEYNAWARY